jgi:hypothetical protein
VLFDGFEDIFRIKCRRIINKYGRGNHCVCERINNGVDMAHGHDNQNLIGWQNAMIDNVNHIMGNKTVMGFYNSFSELLKNWLRT